MKLVYSNLQPKRGVHTAALVRLRMVPREWLAADPVIDYDTNCVISQVPLIAGKSFITLQLLEESMRYRELPRSTATGSFYDIEVAGLLNDHTPELQQAFETYRYHEWVVIVDDEQRRQRLIGNTQFGMRLQINSALETENGGTRRTEMEWRMQTELAPPYYLFSASSSS